MPCKNNGICTNMEDGYSCQCRQGYGGINCENKITTHPSTFSTPSSSPTDRSKAPTNPKPSTSQSTAKSTTTSKPTTTTSKPTSTSQPTTQSTSTTRSTTAPTTPRPTTTVKPTTSTTTTKPTTTTATTTDRPTTTAKPLVTHNLLVNGKIKDKDISKLEKLLNDVLKNLNCTKGAKIVDFHHLINDIREQVTSVDIASECIHGKTLDPNIVSMLNGLLGRTPPFRSSGNHISGQQVSQLKDLAKSYSLNLIGYVCNQNEDAINRKIVNTWITTYPQIPDIKALIVLRDYFVGDYGTHVTKLKYFVTSRFQLLDPRISPSPTTSAFELEFNKVPVVNSIYSGHALYGYTEGIRLPVIDMTSPVTSLVSPLAKVWTDFSKSNKQTPRKVSSANVDIVMSGREPCFSGNRTDLQSSVYFPVLSNGSLLNIELRHIPDTRAVFTTACVTCFLERQFYVDVSGRILLRDRDAVYRVIKDAWKTSQNANQLMFAEKQYFQTNNGDLVTRLWYTHPLDPSDRYSTWPHPDIGGRLDNISRGLGNVRHTLNTLRVERLYRIVLEDNIPQRRMSEVKQKLQQAWADANKHINANSMQLNIVAWSSNYYSIQGNIVTMIDYKVSVANGDSAEVAVQEPAKASMITLLGQASLRVCLCQVYQHRDIGVVGNIGTDDHQAIEQAISSVWESKNPGLSLVISGHVKEMLAGYKSKAGDKATKVVYFVSPFIHGTPVDENDLDIPSLADIKTRMEAVLPGTTVEEHPLTRTTAAKDTDEKPSWLIPVAVASGVVGFLLVMAILTAIIKRHRHKMSKTLNQNPERVEGYDKEHFSEAPDLDNSLNVEDPQWMENEKHKTYIVNM
ncbi:hypothetical protein KP79_PYT08067 [Mizuhopecten yessoensis]|uniref:EGF-like domain-containing protein n=2 Tax=Mizuhopecten yessoensis TaxID=6573 RepID=A0A210Q9I1_MIZYE|nr:hypothetical protein KP79_PYT08067 [Mizuhopecten yessoensis]